MLVEGFIAFLLTGSVWGKGAVYKIDPIYPINVVSREFLSFSVNFDDIIKEIYHGSLNRFAQYLQPAFVRVFDENEHFRFSNKNDSLYDEENTLKTWKNLQRWFQSNQLLPIFPLRNYTTHFNPIDLLPLLNVNQVDGFSCFWLLDYDCNHSSLIKYKQRLVMLKYVLDTYSPSKIVANNLRSCQNTDKELLEETFSSLRGIVNAFSYDYPINDTIESTAPTWISVSKINSLGQFASALQWAKQIGEASRNSYKCIFWHADLNELFNDSPVFWVSVLYKKVIGQTVLDISTNTIVKQRVDVSAYTAKDEQEAIVVCIVNNDNQEFTAWLSLTSPVQKIEVQTYFLTAMHNSTYLNGKKLTVESLLNNTITPKLEVFDMKSHLPLVVPSQSIGLFVIPAQFSSCNTSKFSEDSIIAARLGEFNFNTLKNTLETKEQASKNVGTYSDFRRFLVSKTPRKLETVIAEQPLQEKSEPDKPMHVELQLTNEEIKKIPLETTTTTTNIDLEAQMSKAPKKYVKYKRFVPNLKRLPKNKKNKNRQKRGADLFKRKLFFNHQKEEVPTDDKVPIGSLEEETLKPGEKYVDERLRFLEADGVDSGLREEPMERMLSLSIERIKRQAAESSNDEVKPSSKNGMGRFRMWQNRFKPPADGSTRDSGRRFKSQIVGSRQNKNNEVTLLKEKMDNRKKMGDWIRAKQKKNLLNNRQKRSATYAFRYTPKTLKDNWKVEDLRSIKKKPSYSIENLDEKEFLHNFSSLDGKQRRSRYISNDIMDDDENKISKLKFHPENYIFITTIKANGTTVEQSSTDGSAPKGEQCTTTENIVENKKIWFNDVVDTVKDFIKNIYGKSYYYFMG
ncbi:hypothetical protein FQA39_LY15326 [Lamprigera yunnana]|nr:hypothetical protein FQA39_LY15326 [Lamprigera yunnana]